MFFAYLFSAFVFSLSSHALTKASFFSDSTLASTASEEKLRLLVWNVYMFFTEYKKFRNEPLSIESLVSDLVIVGTANTIIWWVQ